MIPYEPKETYFIGEIKKQIQKFIGYSDVLTSEQKINLSKELGDNYYDERFDGKPFLNAAIDYSVSKWKEENLNLAQLWKDIAINNAKCNNEPYKVANETIESFKQQFNCD